MAYLTAINGNAQGTRYDIERDIVILGRHPDCDIQLEVGAVSRQHARILRQGEVLKLEDMNSRNGTFVNGQAIKEATALADGDLIRICDLEFSVHSDSGEQQLYDSGMMGAEGSSTFGVVLVDDQEDSESHAVMSKIDVRSGTGGSHLTTSAESRLAAVLEIVHSLGKALVVDEVLPKVLDTLFRIFVQADRGFIVLRENGQLVTKWTKMRQSESMQAVRISRTIMREVMENRQAIISLDASSDERFDMSQSVADVKIRSMIVAPLLNSEGEALGAIQMDTMNKRQQFAEADLEILAAVASQAGAAIENAQLHEALVEQKMLEQDLDLAQRVQQAFLPSKPPDLPGFSFFHHYKPAQQIGGDYYDYIPMRDGRVAIIVADVVGHGVSAAMLMAKLSAETRFALASISPTNAAISTLNANISGLGVDKFITFLCLVLDPTSGKIEIVNAGHMAPLWRRVNTTVDQPGEEASGVPLGIMDDYEYDLATIELGPGERLVLYTDGINEAPNAEGACFGIQPMLDVLATTSTDVQHIGNRIIEDVTKYIEGTTQADDMCLLVIGRR